MANSGNSDSPFDFIGKGLGAIGAAVNDAFSDEESVNDNTSAKKFCSNCGAQLTGGNFCPGCGCNVSNQANAASNPPSPSINAINNNRQAVYDGVLHKCPNCGAVVNPTQAVCAECGHYLSNRIVSDSVQTFSEKLFELERSKTKTNIFEFIAKDTDSIDKQILLLIKTYPIPNTVEELTEFMIMASSSIDTERSKRTVFGKTKGYGIEFEKSEAWISKMQQVYKKAEVSFPNAPDFARIRQMYIEKMSELNIKVV